MVRTINALFNDEAGFIVSAELVLIATIAVLAMIVGLSEISLNMNNELEDVGSAFGNLSQNYSLNGLRGHQASVSGSSFGDNADFCDNYCDVQASTDNAGEGN